MTIELASLGRLALSGEAVADAECFVVWVQNFVFFEPKPILSLCFR